MRRESMKAFSPFQSKEKLASKRDMDALYSQLFKPQLKPKPVETATTDDKPGDKREGEEKKEGAAAQEGAAEGQQGEGAEKGPEGDAAGKDTSDGPKEEPAKKEPPPISGLGPIPKLGAKFTIPRVAPGQKKDKPPSSSIPGSTSSTSGGGKMVSALEKLEKEYSGSKKDRDSRGGDYKKDWSRDRDRDSKDFRRDRDRDRYDPSRKDRHDKDYRKDKYVKPDKYGRWGGDSSSYSRNKENSHGGDYRKDRAADGFKIPKRDSSDYGRRDDRESGSSHHHRGGREGEGDPAAGWAAPQNQAGGVPDPWANLPNPDAAPAQPPQQQQQPSRDDELLFS